MNQRNPLRSVFQGLAGGIFLIGLAIAFWVSSQFNGDLFLPILFWALAGSALFGSFGSLKPKDMFGGISGFVFLVGLGILFLPGVSFWPGILILLGITAIVSAIARPLMIALFGAGMLGAAAMANRQSQQPYYQPTQNTDERPYQPYQKGYEQQQYPQEQAQPKYEPTHYEEPQTQYPQELPPQQQ